jgi:phosphinothricin acetyltransferase
VIVVAPMTVDDWPAVREIYRDGISTGNATFETTIPEWPVWNEKQLPAPRLVARERETVIGWAALSRVSARDVYRGVCEVSVYVAAEARGRGVGHRLLEELIGQSEAAGIWTLQASIFPENDASVALHQRLGFRIVGRRERIAKQNGIWRDTLMLERRSAVAGCD